MKLRCVNWLTNWITSVRSRLSNDITTVRAPVRMSLLSTGGCRAAVSSASPRARAGPRGWLRLTFRGRLRNRLRGGRPRRLQLARAARRLRRLLLGARRLRGDERRQKREQGSPAHLVHEILPGHSME